MLANRHAIMLVNALNSRATDNCLSDLHGCTIHAHLVTTDEVEVGTELHCYQEQSKGLRNCRVAVYALYSVQGMDTLCIITPAGELVMVRKMSTDELADLRRHMAEPRKRWGKNNGYNRH